MIFWSNFRHYSPLREKKIKNYQQWRWAEEMRLTTQYPFVAWIEPKIKNTNWKFTEIEIQIRSPTCSLHQKNWYVFTWITILWVLHSTKIQLSTTKIYKFINKPKWNKVDQKIELHEDMNDFNVEHKSPI